MVSWPCPVVVWFSEQFLSDGQAYQRRSAEFEGWKRSALRRRVTAQLKRLSDNSWHRAESGIDRLLREKKISRVERHWIINGFSCRVNSPGDLKALKGLPGVSKIFAQMDKRPPASSTGEARFHGPVRASETNPLTYNHPWYSQRLQADQVWREFGLTGRGIINIIHDTNFVFSKNLIHNLYRSPGEIPDNGADDDNNGYVDDYHGYNFNQRNANLTPRTEAGSNSPKNLHGFYCASIICGAGQPEASFVPGIAPGAQWGAVIGHGRIEEMVEWAVTHGADTYSMSFSLAGFGQYRSHWRKVLEHGAFCGLYFVSGAGNFARPDSKKFARVPFQMRTPEDIPNAVFSAAGVRQDGTRPPFSSQGPVEWQTECYQDGLVLKPDISAFNAALPGLMPDGTVLPQNIAGNSYAGAMLCGSIALMLSADPEILVWDLREIITSTATDIGPPGPDNQTGHGLINCYEAVREILRRKAVRQGPVASSLPNKQPALFTASGNPLN